MNGDIYAHFDQAFDNFVVPAHGTANSGTFGNVLLTKGALASLGIIPLGKLDVASAQSVQIGVGGYELPWLQISQDGIPTTYSLSLSLSDMQIAASSISASRAGVSTGIESGVASVTSALGGLTTNELLPLSSSSSSLTGFTSSFLSDTTENPLIPTSAASEIQIPGSLTSLSLASVTVA